MADKTSNDLAREISPLNLDRQHYKDFLNNTKFQYYTGGIKNQTPRGMISLRDFLEQQTNSDNTKLFEQIAEAENKKDWKLKADLKKAHLSFYSPCVIIGENQNNGYATKVKNGLWKDYAHIKGYTGLYPVDIDHLNKHDIDAIKFRDNIFYACDAIIAAWVSPSKNGVKAIMQIGIAKDVTEFQEYARAIKGFFENYINNKYGEEAITIYDDMKVPTQPLFQSYDPIGIMGKYWSVWTKKEALPPPKEPINIPNDFETDEFHKKVVVKITNTGFNNINSFTGGHPKLVKLSRSIGGYVAYGYLSEIEAETLFDYYIDNHSYLCQKAKTYKKTARDMIKIGMQSPQKLELDE